MQGRLFQRLMCRQAIGIMLAVFFLLSCAVPMAHSAGQKMKFDLFSASFPTEKDGWACGRLGTILKTSDGGNTWTSQNSGTRYTLSSIFFSDAQNGWAVGDVGTILHTKDGGKTWEQQKSPIKTFIMAVYFTDAKTGWASSENTTILHTKDGGQTWEVQFKDQDFILKRISFCDAQNGWVVGEYGYVYHTTDGGVNWKKQAGFSGFNEETGEMIGGNFVFDVKAVDPKTAWIVGIDGYIAKTTDGGNTWQPQANKGVPKAHVFAVNTNGNGSLFVGGNGFLMMSPDGVQNFRDVKAEPKVIYGWLYFMTTRGKTGLVAVGKDGWIYLSDAKGESWKQVQY